jgi:hypothetical protein
MTDKGRLCSPGTHQVQDRHPAPPHVCSEPFHDLRFAAMAGICGPVPPTSFAANERFASILRNAAMRECFWLGKAGTATQF